MKKLLIDEKGQAIAEMAVSMIAIMAVFLGVIFAFAIGSTNIDNLIACRREADNDAYSSFHNGSGGDQIYTWNEGNDERMFTNDDEPQIGTNDEPEIFKAELQSDNIDLLNGFGSAYVQNNFAADLSEINSIFLSSANMTSYSMESDPYETMNLEDMRGLFSTLFFSSDLIIENSVYMPMLNAENPAEEPEETE